MSELKKPVKALKHEGTSLQVVVSGAIAGLVSRFCIAPLDVCKIRLQLQAQAQAQAQAQTQASHSPSRTGPIHLSPTGTIATFRSIIRNEGVTALWKGNIPAEALYLTYGGAQFLGYRTATRCLESLPDPVRLPGSVTSFVSGAAAGALATTATYPLDLLRTRFAAQGQTRVYPSLRDSLTQITRAEGYKGFYRGLDAAIVQIVPYMGLFFAFYEGLKPLLAGSGIPLDAIGSAHAMAGVGASVLAKTAVFPLDTVRKRLQVQGPTRDRYAYGRIPSYDSGVLLTLRTIAVTEGRRGLYRGLTVGLLKAAPASAITMWTYERVMGLLQSMS